MSEPVMNADDKLLAAKLLDQAYRGLRISVYAALSISVLIVLALWSSVAHGMLLAWFAVNVAVQLRNAFYLRSYLRIGEGVAIQVEKWERKFVAGAAISGISWGSMVFCFPTSPFDPVALLVIFIIAGVTAFASVSMAAIPAAVNTFLLATLMPLAIWLFSFNEHMFTVMSLIVASYLAAMMSLSRKIYDMVRGQLSSKAQNKLLTQIVHESDRRMASFFASAPGFFYTAHMSPAGVSSMPFVSAGITDLIGIPAENVAHNLSPLLELIHPEDAPKLMDARAEALKNMTELRAEFRINHPRKGERWIELRSLPLQDQDAGTILHGYMHDITERKGVDAALQQRETEFRTLAENAPDPIYRYDRDCRRIYVNPAVSKLTGIPLEQMLGKSPNEFVPVPTVDSDKVQRCIQRVLDTGMPGELEISFRAADGRDVIVHNNLVPEFDSAGKVRSVLCIGRDITARKQMEEVLLRSEQEYRTLAENFPDNIMRLDREYRVIYANKNLETALGMPASYLLGKVPTEVFADGLFDDLAAAIKDAVASGRSGDCRITMPDRNGGERYHHLSITPELDERGEMSGILVIGRDMTERLRMEAVLQASEEKHRTVFESANDGIFLHRIVERDGETEFILHDLNRKGCELWGHTREDILSGNFDLLAMNNPPYSFEEATRRNKLAAAGEPQLFEWELKRGDGSRTWGEINLRRIQIGGEAFLLAVMRDLNERKTIENDLRDSERMLQEAQRIAHVGSWDVDMVNDRLVWSDEIFRIWEIDKTKFKADFAAFVETVHPEDRERVVQAYNDAVVNRSLYEVEHRLLFPDGRVKHILERGEPQYDADGKPVRFVGTSLDVTERKRMEDNLAVRERDFRNLAGNIPDNIARWDTEGRYLYVNPTHERLLGSKLEELVGQPIPDSHAHVKAAVAHVVTTGQAIQTVRQPAMFDGVEQLHDVSLVPEFDETGKVISVLGLGRDMTERYRLLEAIAAREQEFRSLAESSPDTIIRYDNAGRIRYLNSSLVRLLELGSADEVVGKRPSEAWPDGRFDQFEQAAARAVETGDVQAFEMILPREPGELSYGMVSVVPERDTNGDIIGTIAFGREITAIRETQRQLELLEYAINVSSDAIYLIDGESLRFGYVNDGACRALGYSREELLAMEPSDIDPDMPREQGAEIMKNSPVGLRVSFETRHRAKDGRIFPVELSGTHFERDGRKFSLSVVRDITERKRMEEQLRSTADFQQTLLKGIRDSNIQMMVFESGRVVYANDTDFTAQLGYSAEEMAAHPPFIDMVHPDDRALVMDRNRRRLAGESVPPTYEIGVLMGDGSRREIDLAVSIIPGTEPVRLIAIARDITERKQAEEALRQSETRFRTLYDSTRDAVMLLDERGFFDCNASTLEIFGCTTREEFCAKHPADLSPPVQPDGTDSQTLANRHIAKAMQDGGLRFEWMHRRADNEQDFPAEVLLSSMVMDGKPVLQATVRDISERKRMEEILIAREAEFRALVEQAPEPIFRYAPDGRRLYVNAAVERISGIPASKLLEASPADGKLSHSGNGDKIVELVRSISETGESAEIEVENIGADGCHRWFNQRLAPEFGTDGKVRSVLSICHDITERKRMEKAALENEARYRQIFDNSQDGVFLLDVTHDRRFRVAEANPAFERLIGIGRADMLNRFIEEVLLPETAKKVSEKYQRCLDAGTVYREEQELVLPVGRHTYFTTLVPVRDEEGRICRIVGIASDITARKQAERQLKETLEFSEGVINAIPDLLFEVDREGRYLNVWAQNQQLLAAQKELLLGNTINEMLSPEAAAISMAAIVEAEEKGLSLGKTICLALPQGECWFELSVSRKAGGDSSNAHFLVLSRDVTSRKQAELALRANEEKMRSLYELSPLGIALTDMQGRYVEFNEAFRAICAYPVDELMTLDYWTLTPKEYEAKEAEQIEALAKTGRYGPYEKEYRQKDGTLIPIQLSGMLVTGKDGQQYIWSIVEDIRARRKTEAALREKFERIVELNDQLEINARDLEDQAVEYEAQAVELEASQEQIKQTEAWYRGIVRSAPDGMLVVNESGRISLVNAHLEKMFGYTEGELLGQPMEILLPSDTRQEHVAKRDGFFASGAPGRPMDGITNGLRACRKDGSVFPVDVSLSRLPDADGRSGIICAAIRDVTERKRMEDVLVAREQESRTLLENSPDNISRYNRECRRIYANPTYGAMVEGGVATLLGKKPSEYPGGPNADIYEAKIREVFASGLNSDFELRWPDKDGREICSHVRLTAERDANGAVVSVMTVGRDITELNEHRKRVYQMAFYDALTSLPNRALFSDRLRQMITDASWHAQQAGVMLLDLDRFKAVNDTLGHPAGDELLREAAARLTYCVRGYDTVARLGGDEFAILLPEVRSGDDLGRIANKILQAFNEPFLLEGKEVFVSSSIGIAVYPTDSEDGDDLVKQADSAMYFAKRSGRNNFRFYSKDLTVSANERLTLEGALRRGFARGELELYYQPKISLTDGALIGSEALLRWNHPQRGMVPPDKFISIAEDSGLIVEIGEWVLLHASRTACEWNGSGKPLHKVAINLSARQFQSNNLVKSVRKVLDASGCYPEWIELEITESLLLDEDGAVLEALDAFREMGITVAIDDFGTGYSALSYLARFPIDTLKIDRSFTSRVTENGHHAELVKAILSIAHSLHQKVVAEGVETAGQAAFLQAHGCHIAQGYLYSKPVPKIAFEALPRVFG